MEFDYEKIDLDKVKDSLRISGFSSLNSELILEKSICENFVDENNLSGGERQRLGIARALYFGSPIICLDEISSALDPITERNIFKSLREIAKSKIVISIAHRFSVLERGDKVIFLGKGEILDSGILEDLIQSSEQFAKLYNIYYSKD